MVRRKAVLCGQGEDHLCGQAQGPSLWPGARTFYVARGEDILVARCVDFLCGQARGPSLWRGKGPFCVVRREALLCGQARGLSLWLGARPFSVVRRGHPLVVRCKPRREMRECIILKKNVAKFIIFITTSYFCCCELSQILKRPNSGV